MLAGVALATLVLPIAFLPWESPWLRARLERTLQEHLGARATAHVGSVLLDSGPPGYVILQVSDLELHTPTLAARIPGLELHLSLAGLLTGNTTPRRIHAHDAEITLAAATGSSPDTRRTPLRLDPDGLRQVTLVNTRILAPTGVTVTFTLAEAAFPARQAPRLDASGAVAIDDATVPFSITTTPLPDDAARASLRLEAAPLGPLARRLLPASPDALAGSAALETHALFSENGTLERIEVELTGDGPVAVAPPTAGASRLTATALRASASLDPANGTWSRGVLRAVFDGPTLEIDDAGFDPVTGTLQAVVGLRDWTWRRLDALVTPDVAAPTRHLLAGLADQPTLERADASLRVVFADGAPAAWRADFLAEGSTPRGPARIAGEAERLPDGTVRAAADLHAVPLIAALVGLDAMTGGAASDVPVSGPVALRLEGGALRSASASLVLGDGWIEAPAWLEERAAVAGGGLRVTFAEGRWRCEAARLEVEGAAVRATVDATPDATEVAFRVDDIDMTRLHRLWPTPVLPKTRFQVLRFVPSGTLLEARGRVVLPADPAAPPVVAGDARFEALRVDTNLGLPEFEGLRGTGVFDARGLRFTLAGGTWNGANVRAGDLHFTGFDEPRQHLAIELGLDGAFRDFLPLLQFLPPGLAAALGDAFAETAGTGSIDLSVGIPLIRDLLLADCPIDGTIRFRDLTPRLPLAGAAARVHSGSARVQSNAGGVTADVDVGHATLDWPGIARGTLATRLEFRDSGPTERMRITADLGGLAVTLPVAGVSKEAGQPGGFAATLGLAALEPGAAEAELDLGPQAAVRAHVRLREDDGTSVLEEFRLDAAPLGASRFAAVLARTPEGGLRLELDGAALDLEPVLAARGGGPAGPPPADTFLRPPHDPLALAIRVDNLRLGADFEVAGARVDGAFAGGVWRTLGGTGTVDGAPFEASVGPADASGSQPLRLRSPRGGGLLRALDVTARIGGGLLTADGTVRQGPGLLAFDVGLALRDFRLLEAPVFARILAAAALTGLPSALGRQGLAFQGVEARITYGAGVIRIPEALMWGREIGVQVKRAELDLAARTQDIDGILWPGYALNAVFRNVPLLNWLLTGPDGKGVVGIGFRVEGTLDNPIVRANRLPTIGVLSALMDAGRRLNPVSAPRP